MQKNLWARQVQGTLDTSPTVAHAQASLGCLEMSLWLREYQNSEAVSFHPQRLKILAYFLGPRYTFRTPSVVGLNHRDSGFVWWQVQDHNQEYPQAAPVRSHSLHKKGFSPGMHALTHGATVLSMEGRYLHFTLLKLTQPHLIPETKWTRERSVSTPPGTVGMIQFHVGKKKRRDNHFPEPRGKIFCSLFHSC